MKRFLTLLLVLSMLCAIPVSAANGSVTYSGDAGRFIFAPGSDHSQDNVMAYMFNATADATAQLTDWVCLGTLYSGGIVNLDVTLEVPVTLGNEFQNQIGYLDWEFKIEEFPVDPDDPEPPKTGDETNVELLVGLMCVSAVALLVLLILMKRKRKDEEDQDEE